MIEELKKLCKVSNDTILREIKICYEKQGYINTAQEQYVKIALSKHGVEKPTTKSKPKKSTAPIHITITNQIALAGLTKNKAEAIKKKYTINNPKWFENSRMGRWQGDTPRFLFLWSEFEGIYYVPCGCLDELQEIIDTDTVILKDNTQNSPVEINFKGKLKDFQKDAVNDILPHNFGTLVAPTGAGKTVMGLYVVAGRKQKTLIIVHTKDLAHQWVERIHTFLDVKESDVGMIGAGKKKVGKKITVGLVQSIYSRIDELSNEFGNIVQDECHRTPSRSMSEAVNGFNARYKLGLTATPKRRDGLTKLIFWYLGDIRHEVNKKMLVDEGHIMMPWFILKNTEFIPEKDPVEEYSAMLKELTEDQERNNLIVTDISRQNKTCLIISDRTAHLKELQRSLKNRYKINSELLIGPTPNDERAEIISKVNSGKCQFLFATGQLIGEGFDCKNLDRLFITTPIKFSGRVLQYIGRIMRPADGKDRPIVYDYVDQYVDPLKNSARARIRVYGKENIK